MIACPHSQTPNFIRTALIHKAFLINFHPGNSTDSTNQCINEINHLRASFERCIEAPRLLQDETQTYDSKALSRWFASRPNARQEARNVASEIADNQPKDCR